MGFNMAGSLSMGINKPHKNNMGNLKKLDRVWASNTSLTDTATNKPSKAEVIAIKTTPIMVILQLTPLRSTRNAAKITGTKALTMPNRIAPSIFAKTNILILIGANNNLSKDLLLFSNVMVTASMDVVPNNMLMAIKPGNSSTICISPDKRIICIKVQERGKIIPN